MYQLKANQQQTIVALRGQGRSKRRIARELDVDRATVRKYLAQADSKSPTPQTGSDALPPSESPTNPQTGSSPGFGPASLWEPRREAIERALAQGQSIQRIYQDLVAEGQFTGSYFAPLRGGIFMMSSISIWLA
jgi:predicted transcriptional regulator